MMPPTKMKWIRRIIAATIIAVLCFVRWPIHGHHSVGSRRAGIARSKSRHGNCGQILRGEGKWPSNWDDLTTVKRDNNRGMYAWPTDADKIKDLVEIDFHSDPRELAKQSIQEFEAIKPIGPFYPYKQDGYVESLLETLKKKNVR